MEALIETARELTLSYGPRVIAAVAVLVIGWWIARIMTAVIRRVMAKGGADPTLTGFLANIAYFALLTLVVISALGQLGVNTTSFAAVIAGGALAIGFALQGSLSNFAAGVMLILFRPFRTGDFIEAGGVAGIVEEIEIFATRLRTGDNKQIVVPNGSITSGTIVNYSAKDTRRIDLVIGIGYSDDIARARATITEILKDEKRVLDDPAPTVAVLELAESSVNLAVRPWVRTVDYWPVLFDLTERIKVTFDARGISIPFPQRDVHVRPAA